MEYIAAKSLSLPKPPKRRRCAFGWHVWHYFRMSHKFRLAFPEMAHWGRTCVYCDKLQYLSDNKKHWQNGCRGVLVVIPERKSDDAMA